MVELDVAIRSIEGTKLAEDVTSDSSVAFNANANLVEGDRNPGRVSLKFTIELSTNPEVAKVVISGTADLKGEDQEIEALLTPKEPDSVPPVFMKIYQKVYSIMYLLSGSLHIPYPSPGLLKGVHLASAKEMSQSVSNQARA
jgi:hypothetical protein